jgi:hypothetical protein
MQVQISYVWNFCFLYILIIGRHIVPTNALKKPTEREISLQSKLKINGNSVMTFIGGITGNAHCFLTYG